MGGIIIMVVVTSLSFLLIIVFMPFMSGVEFRADLQAIQIRSFKKYRAHSSMAAISSNEELMKSIRIETANELDSGVEYYQDSSFTKEDIEDAISSILFGDRSDSSKIKSNIIDLMRNQTDSYRFLIKERKNEEIKTRLKINTTTNENKRYSSIFLASPSENRHKMIIGVSDQN